MLIHNATGASQAVLPLGRSAQTEPSATQVNSANSITAPSAIAEQQPSPAQLKGAVDNFNKVMQQANQSLEFSIDSDTKKPVIRLIDTETGELIRQIPSEEMLAIARSIDQFQQGMLLKQNA
jgi:flagellar protein FlaG